MKTLVVCILLALAEFLAAVLIVAPRAIARKLVSLLRALLRRAQRIAGAPSPRRKPARPSREGA